MVNCKAEPQDTEIDAGSNIEIVTSDGYEIPFYREVLHEHSEVLSSKAATSARVEAPFTKRVASPVLHFMRQRELPDLDAIPFGTLSEFAEAVETCKIEGALEAVKGAMQARVQGFPIDVLHYAVRHAHLDLADEAAEEALNDNLTLATHAIDARIFGPWLRYSGEWLIAQQACAYKSWQPPCPHWPELALHVAQALTGPPGVIRSVDPFYCLLAPCEGCRAGIVAWSRDNEAIVDALPTFSDVLLGTGEEEGEGNDLLRFE